MSRSPIRLDVSSCSGIVIYCSECEHWAAFRFGKQAAWDAACAHEELVHPARREQRDARDQRAYEARHAG